MSATACGELDFAGLVQLKDGIPTSYNPTKKVQDKLLFTPGPLTTSFTVKAAMLSDLGSRDVAFTNTIKTVCQGLLDVAGVSEKDWTVVPVQGSGTFAVESVITSSVPRKNGKLLIIANGAYGLRIGQMAKIHQIDHTLLSWAPNESPVLATIEQALREGAHTHVVMVHSETTSGIINDVFSVGKLVKQYGRSFIVDAMSSFGAIPVDLEAANVDFIVSSANKCIEGVPGFAFAICRKSALATCKGNARVLALDLEAQRAGLDASTQFRYTPPTHSMLAFKQALDELKLEGGPTKRGARYSLNQQTFQAGMKKMGFDQYLPPQLQGCIISSYVYPKDKNWDFQKFYQGLNDRGFVIYPGKVSDVDCFRIGHIGRLFPSDMQNLLKVIDEVCREMKTNHHFKSSL
jgi:2-aminoethylphosphonate-pyruvate transaminase